MTHPRSQEDDRLEDFTRCQITLDGTSRTVYVAGTGPAVIVMAEKPSLPLNEPGGIEIAPEEIAAVRQRLEREDLTVLAYRFEGDRFCRAQRFAAYAEALGDRFVGRVLPDSAANPDPPPFFAQHVPGPHSVVTAHLIDAAGEPTLAARDDILSFFRQRLA